MIGDKYYRYQQRHLLAGKCERCNREASPYRLCAHHRQWKRVNRALRRMVLDGSLTAVRTPNGNLYTKTGIPSRLVSKQSGRVGDRRCLPRMKGRPFDINTVLTEMMIFKGGPMSLEEIKEVIYWRKYHSREAKQ